MGESILDSELLPEEEDVEFDPDCELAQDGMGENTGALKECYSAIPGIAKVYEELKALQDLVDGQAPYSEVSKLVNAIRQDFGRAIAYVHRRINVERKDQALTVIRDYWKLQERNISAEQVNFMHRVIGMTKADIAKLMGITQAAVHSRITRFETNEMPFDGLEIEKLSDEEKVQVVIKKLFLKAAGSGGDREAINAAKIFIELHNKQLERDIVTKWKQIELLSEFFFSKLIPELHQKLQEMNAGIDIRAVCYGLFETADRELQAVSKGIELPKEEKRPVGRPKGSGKKKGVTNAK